MGVFNADGSVGGGGGSVRSGRFSSGIDWGSAGSSYVKQYATHQRMQTLSDIGNGKSNLGYNDQIKFINQAKNDGLINHGDTINLINKAVDVNSPNAKPPTFNDYVGAAAGAVGNAIASIPKGIADQATNIYKQSVIASHDSGVPQKLADNTKAYLQTQVKAGHITQAQADAHLAKVQSAATANTKSIQAAEKEQGTKYNPSSAVMDTLDLGSNFIGAGALLDGVKTVGKNIIENGVKSAVPAVFKAAAKDGAKTVATDAGGSAIGDTAIHLPSHGVYARLSPEQVAHLKNEVANIPASAGDLPHLTAITPNLTKGAKEVSLEDISKLSPNSKTALESVPGPTNVSPLPSEIANAGGELPKPNGSILSNAPKVAANDTKGAINNRNFVVNQYQNFIKPVQDAAKNMSKNDIKLLENIEVPAGTKPEDAAKFLQDTAQKADNPKQFIDVATKLRAGYDARLASDVSLGRDVGTRQNYLPHLFDHTDPHTADMLEQLSSKKAQVMGEGTPGYTKPRTFDNYAEADAAGMKRANGNVLEDFYQSMNRAGYEHGRQALIKGLNEAHPNLVQLGKVGRGTDGNLYKELHIPGGHGITLPEDLADKYNTRAFPKEATGPLGVYDKANGVVKFLKLGGGLFHSFTTAGTHVGQQLASLNLLKHPIENLKVVAGTLSKSAHDANWAKLAADGADSPDGMSTIDRMKLAGVTTSSKQTAFDVDSSILNKMATGNPASKLIHSVHEMVFGRQIPEVKALMFKQATKGLDVNNPADRALMEKIASGVNNIGGINRAVEGLTPSQARNLGRVVLAPDFTEGKFRTLFNGMAKWGANNPQGKVARQMIVGKSLVFAIPGMTALVASGQLDLTDPKAVGNAFMSQILNPQLPTSWRTPPTKSNPNGTPISLKLPATFISEIGKIIAPALDPLSADKTSGIKDYASARLAALPSFGEQMGTNRDFFGNPIYGGTDANGQPITDSKGNEITPGDTALNIANQVLPIPAVQGIKSLNGQNVLQSAANVLGFRASSDPTSPEGQHSKKVTDFYTTYNAIGDARSKVVKQMNTLVAQGNINQATRIAHEFNDSIPQRTATFKQRYSNDWNPAFDAQFKGQQISTSGRAIKGRQEGIQKANAVLR